MLCFAEGLFILHTKDLIKGPSVMTVPTLSGVTLQTQRVRSIASIYPDFYFPDAMNTRLVRLGIEWLNI